MRSLSRPRTLLRGGAKLARLALGIPARLPREVQIEVTNRCNLDCDMCPRLSPLGVPEVDMAPETFAAILERLRAPHTVTLTGWGEPLLHPRLFELLDLLLARFPGVAAGFTTNGHLLTERVVERILARPLARVTVSLEEVPFADAASPGGHDPRKGHANAVARAGHPSPADLAAKLRHFLARRHEHAVRSGRAPEVRLQAVLFPGGLETTVRLVDFAADLGCAALNLVRLDPRGRPDLVRPSYAEERRILAAARARAEARGLRLESVNDHGPLLRMASRGDRVCVRLDDYIYVDVHGNVAPCCLLRDERLGNLLEEPLEAIWSSPACRRFQEPRRHPACEGCDAFLNGYAAPARAAEEAPCA